MKFWTSISILFLLVACEIFEPPGKLPAKWQDLCYNIPNATDSLRLYTKSYSNILAIHRYLKSSDPESRIIAARIVAQGAKDKLISMNSAVDIILDGVEHDILPSVSDSTAKHVRKELILVISNLLVRSDKNIIKYKIPRLKRIADIHADTRYHFLYILNFLPNQTLKNPYFEDIAIRNFHLHPFSGIGYLGFHYLYSVKNESDVYREILLDNFNRFWYGPWKSYISAESVLGKIAEDGVLGDPFYNMLYNGYPIPTPWWLNLYISAISSFGMKAVPSLKSIYETTHLPGSAKYWVGYTIALAMHEDKIDKTEFMQYLREIVENSKDTVLVERALRLLNNL